MYYQQKYNPTNSGQGLLLKKWSLLVVFTLFMTSLSFAQSPITVVVDCPYDDGSCAAGETSLRDAINTLNANTGFGGDINFEIDQADYGNAPYDIVLSAANGVLNLNESITIDGNTQESNGYTGIEPLISISGVNVPATTPTALINIFGTSSSIKHIAFHSITGNVIDINNEGAEIISNTFYDLANWGSHAGSGCVVLSDGVVNPNYITIQGNNFGTNRGNTISPPSSSLSYNGIQMLELYGEIHISDVLIGGEGYLERNVFTNTYFRVNTEQNPNITSDVNNVRLSRNLFTHPMSVITGIYAVPTNIVFTNGIISGTAQPGDRIEIFGASATGTASEFINYIDADQTTGAWSLNIGAQAWEFISVTATENPNNYSAPNQPNTSVLVSVTNTERCDALTSASANNNGPVCDADDLVLSALPLGATYTWEDPNSTVLVSNSNNSSYTTSTALTGTYELTISVTGCTDAVATTNVVTNANPGPATPVISLNGNDVQGPHQKTICSDENIVLSTAVVAGLTYEWGSGEGFFSNSPTPAAFIENTSTNYTLRVTDANGCYADAQDLQLTVNPTPETPNINSNSPVCYYYGEINLTTTSTTTGSYNWSGPDGFTSTDQNPTIESPIDYPRAGDYTLTITEDGCTSDPASTNVQVNDWPEPNAIVNGVNILQGDNAQVCLGDNVTLETTPIPNATYSWTELNYTEFSNQATTSINNITLAQDGNYRIRVTDEYGCVGDLEFFINVNNLPAAPQISATSPVCIGGTINLSSSTSATAYNWTTPSGATLSGATAAVNDVSANDLGAYNLSIEDANGCSSPNASATVSENTSAVACCSNVLSTTGSNLVPNGDFETLGADDEEAPNWIFHADYSLHFVNHWSCESLDNINPSCNGHKVLLSGIYPNVEYLFLETAADVNVIAGEDYQISLNAYNETFASVVELRVYINDVLTLSEQLQPHQDWDANGLNEANYSATFTALTNGANIKVKAFTSSTEDLSESRVLVVDDITIKTAVCDDCPSTLDITADNEVLCAGDPIALHAPSFVGATYSWTGPNGFTSNEQNPTIAAAIAASGGNYKLVVSGNDCGDLVANIAIQVLPGGSSITPNADVNSPVCVGSPISLSVEGSSGATYSWTGPNGFTSTEQNPTINQATLADAGSYQVTITRCGTTSPAATVNVVVQDVTNQYAITATNTECKTFRLTYTGPSIPEGSQWAFGDGTFSDPVGAGTSIMHTYPAAGTYVVTLTGVNINNGGCPIAQTVTVTDFVDADFAYTINDPCQSSAGVDVVISNYDANYTYEWDVNGIKSTTTSQTTTLTTGLINVNNIIKLTVTDGTTGCKTSVSKVLNIGAPSSNFITPAAYCENSLLNVSSVATNGQNYTWTITKPNNSVETSTARIPYYVLSDVGTYQLSLLISNTYEAANGDPIVCSDPATVKSITVNENVNANFTATEDDCGGGVAITPPSNTSISAYYIDYGDGTAMETGSTYPDPMTHAYSNDGAYTIKMDVFNGACRSTQTKNVYISRGAAGVIMPLQASICGTGSVTLSAQLLNIPANAGTLTYEWTDPNNNTTISETLIATIPGNYSLHITGSGGSCAVDITANRTIVQSVEPVVSNLTTTPIECNGTGGLATFTLSKELAQQGYYVNNTLVAADPSASADVTESLSNLAVGTNYVTVANASNTACATVFQVNLTTNTPSINKNVTGPSDCNGTGSATAAPSSPATGANTISWYPAGNYPAGLITTGNSVSGLSVGSYIVELTNDNCKVKEYFSIVPPGIALSMANTNINTCSGTTTQAQLNIHTPITGSLSYTWTRKDGNGNYSIAVTSGNISVVGSGSVTQSLVVGDYKIVVTSPGGCSATHQFSVGALKDIQVSLDITPPSCKEVGEVNPYTTGGDGNYTYAWTLGGIMQTPTTEPTLSLENVVSTSHVRVKVTDNSGCSTTYPALEALPLDIPVVAPLELVACSGANTGTGDYEDFIFVDNCNIQACVSGGTAPYSYKWMRYGEKESNIERFFEIDQTTGQVYNPNSTTPITIPLASPGVIDEAVIEAANNDGDVNTFYYPYWKKDDNDNYELDGNGDPIPALSSQKDNLGDPYPQPYSVNEKIIENDVLYNVENGAATGASGHPIPNGEFESGSDYQLTVVDAAGCERVFEVGTITLPTIVPSTIEVTYVFAINKQIDEPEDPEEPINQILAENMDEAADEMMDAAGRCFQAQAASLQTQTRECANPTLLDDEFSVSYGVTEHHYTLYYYDRANRLTKTVPPQGVNPLTVSQVTAIKTFREEGTVPGTGVYAPVHTMPTNYQYNSLDQLVSKHTPDGGRLNFIYDGTSRLRFSQNAKQAPNNYFSYTRYDELGRLIEVGESNAAGPNFSLLAPKENESVANNVQFPSSNNREVTTTTYSQENTHSYYGKPQRYLQNRISFTKYDVNPSVSGDEYVTTYSYDVHGNVDWLIQSDPELGDNYIAYEYDLVSGKVLNVKYNENREDKFYHQYSYDAGNRIEEVATSRNGEVWDIDASYTYYAHGPLKQQIIGEDKVQGLDKLYTINGWLKSINTPHLSATDDPGEHGKVQDINVNMGLAWSNSNSTASDRFGMMLNYFKGDFTRNINFLNNSGTTSGNEINTYQLYEVANNSNVGNDLYNGNIASWIQGQLDDQMNPQAARASLYRYDALNRIKQSTNLEQNGTTGWQNVDGGTSDTYKTNYTYDANGNILSLDRYTATGDQMDELRFTYLGSTQGEPATESNQLASVTDAISTHIDSRGDMEGTHNYHYDNIGNLEKSNTVERLNLGSGYQLYDITTDIEWNVAGKISKITKQIDPTGLNKTEEIKFAYDAQGNRTRKTIIDADLPCREETIYYVRDASGNIMSIYKKGEENVPGVGTKYAFSMTEQPIYGSARVGQNTQKVILSAANTCEDLLSPGDGTNEKSEYQNWITSANKKQLLPGTTDELCNCEVSKITYNETNDAYEESGSVATFLGVAHNGVAIAENLNDEMQFYAIQVEHYLGKDNVCLVYDKTGKLMQGTEGIGAIDINSKPVIVNLTGSNKYALITLNDEQLPMYHIIDMDQNGYGGNDASGEVIAHNLPLSNYSGTAPLHGWHFTGYEDHINNKTIVYSTRYHMDPVQTHKGVTEIVAYEMNANYSNLPTEHTLYQLAGCANTQEGELQISPKGDKLAWYHHKENRAGFKHRMADIYMLDLGANKLSITGDPIITPTTLGANAGEGRVEFMDNNEDVLYAQRGLYEEPSTEEDRNIWKYEKLSGQFAAINPFTTPDITYLFLSLIHI